MILWAETKQHQVTARSGNSQMCIFLLSGIMQAFEIVNRDVIRHAYSKRSFSLVLFHVFFFSFLTENARDLEWVQACNFVADITGLGHVLFCPWDYLSNRIQLLPAGSLSQGTPEWKDDQESFSSHIKLIPSLWAQFLKENSCKKALYFSLPNERYKEDFNVFSLGKRVLFLDIF